MEQRLEPEPEARPRAAETPAPPRSAPPLARSDLTDAPADLLPRLPHDCPARAAAEAILAGLSPPPVGPLLAALADPAPQRWAERAVAAWVLGRAELTPDERYAAAAALCGLLENRAASAGERLVKRPARRLRRALAPAAVSALLVTLCFLVVTLVNDGLTSRTALQWLIGLVLGVAVYALALMPLALAGSAAYDGRRSGRVRAEAAAALGRLGAFAGVGPLARAAAGRDARVREVARRALPPLLAALTPAHRGGLGPGATPALCALLWDSGGAFTVQVLQALEQTGEGEACPAVERFLASDPTPPLREAALSALARLRERRDAEHAAHILLRASAPAAPDSGTLLRPAAGVSEGGAGEMLRPSLPPDPAPPDSAVDAGLFNEARRWAGA